MRFLFVVNMTTPYFTDLGSCIKALVPKGQFAQAILAPLPSERRALRWDADEYHAGIIPVWRSREDAAAFRDWWANADVVLCSEKLFGPMAERLRQRRCVFYATERWFKPPLGKLRFIHPVWAWKAMQFRRLAHSEYMHYLAIGRFAAADMHWLTSMPGRVWQWGYFVSPSCAVASRPQREGLRVLWAGRMLRWKRVQDLILAFSRLSREQNSPWLTLIGDGPEKRRLIQIASECLPKHNYEFSPPIRPSEIRAHMRDADVYVLPSDGYEGWGVVINEAMSEGCVVVAAAETGAGSTLIQHAFNGMVFQSRSRRRLAQILCDLACDGPLRVGLARAGKETVDSLWAPSTAASRLISVSDSILSGRPVPVYAEGPMQQL